MPHTQHAASLGLNGGWGDKPFCIFYEELLQALGVPKRTANKSGIPCAAFLANCGVAGACVCCVCGCASSQVYEARPGLMKAHAATSPSCSAMAGPLLMEVFSVYGRAPPLVSTPECRYVSLGMGEACSVHGLSL